MAEPAILIHYSCFDPSMFLPL